MKLIDKAFVFLSLISLGLANLEAKSLEFFLDHRTQDTFHVQTSFPTDQIKQRWIVENVGNAPVKNCFPSVNQVPHLTLEALASKLADAKQPLLALYARWQQAVKRHETRDQEASHPLDLLNFKGACSAQDFIPQFIKLCHALGIDTRLAHIHGLPHYDFCLDDDWNFLDLTNGQFYLGWDNESLVSSEDVMDDPLLALRTKHPRDAAKVDVKEAWKQLAHFEILEPTSAPPVALLPACLRDRVQSIDLYPHETLAFSQEAPTSQCVVEHTLNLEQRQVSLNWTYHAPFPLAKLVNASAVPLALCDQSVVVEPGQSYDFQGQETFDVTFNFNQKPIGQVMVSGVCSSAFFPALNLGENCLSLGTKTNDSVVRFHYACEEEAPLASGVEILNQQHAFDYCAPFFKLDRLSEHWDTIRWQIALDPHFQVVPSNFDQVEPFTSVVTLPLISETFLNPETSYYFRVKGCCQGRWSEWSAPYSFVVHKPLAVETVEFEQTQEGVYTLNWERCAEEVDEPIEYWVFGSNALDFIPALYCDKQVNAVVEGEVTEEEANDNLIAITTEPHLSLTHPLAYYRIIAKQRGQYSVPSRLIRLYDQGLIQPRHVLQLVDKEHCRTTAKRTLFPAAYPWSDIALPLISRPNEALRENNLIKLQLMLRSAAKLESTHSPYYEFPDVPNEVWEEVRPYLLPENHPAWPKLNRIFCKVRATQNPDTFRKVGFKRWQPGRWSRVSASSHPELRDYFIKAYCDCEMGILYDWKKWIHRIKGAEAVRDCIKNYQLQSHFKVPRKWIYPLPKNPSPFKNVPHRRKNFILVAENMHIQEHEKNEKLYKRMSKKLMDGLYTLLQVCGLYDSVYCFNIPFCKDGKLAVIDTEYHHKWPVPFHKLNHFFSKEQRAYWEKITYKGGRIPDGVSEPNPPRMDRRDIPRDDAIKKVL